MKFFSLVLLLTSVNAYACPNFAGSYSCKNEDETVTMTFTITQEEDNGVTIYHQTMGEEQRTLTADGVARPYTVKAEGREIEGTISANCSDPSLTIQFLANYKGMDIDHSEAIEAKNGKLKIHQITKVGGDEYNSADYDCKPTN